MIKDFFKKNSHLKLGLQHLDLLGGGWKIEIYNTTYDFGIDPIFEHYIVDEELERLNVDFETAIMTPVINWKEDLEKKRENQGKITEKFGLEHESIMVVCGIMLAIDIQ